MQHRRKNGENEQNNQDWTDVTINASDLLLSAADHEKALAEAIEQAHSHLLIVSAHVRKEILDKLKDPIKAAIEREVRVDVLFGLPSLDEGGKLHADTTKDWLKEVRKSLSGGKGDRLTGNEEALGSDAKVLIWDAADGSYHAILGSYNWLYGLDGPSKRIGSDIGIRLSDPRLVGNICSTLSGWLDDCHPQSSGVSLRLRNMGPRLSQKDPPAASGDAATATKARVIYNETHATILREGLVNASRRLLVSSHKLNRIATGNPVSGGGRLDWLAGKKPASGFSCVLVIGRSPKEDSWTGEDQKRLEELVEGQGGMLRIGTGTHARVLIYDEVAVVSGYNFLSTTHDKRQIGVMFQGGPIPDALWNALALQNPSPALTGSHGEE